MKHLSNFLQGISVLVLLFVWCNMNAQQVSPFQTGHNSTCFINVRDMAKMEAGLFVISYNYLASTDTYADKNGDKRGDIDLLNGTILPVKMSTIATIPALYWGSKKKILGGATFVAGVVPNYIWANVDAVYSHKGGLIDSSFTIDENIKINGFGDLFISPLGLSYGWKHADLTIDYAVTAPTGRYSIGADDNIGLGFWTNQFQAYGYYYPKEDQSTAIMGGLTYEINGKIKGEDYKPGDRLSLEYGISQYLSDRLELSVMGGNIWQIQDDKGDDVGLNATVHDQISNLAFAAAYWAIKGRLYVSAKYLFDYAGKQRFLTNGGMVNLIFVTNAMDGVKNK